MANASQKKTRQKNKQVLRVWVTIVALAAVVSALCGFVFKVSRRPPPKRPHIRGQPRVEFRPRKEIPFWSGLVVAVLFLGLIYNRIRFRRNEGDAALPAISGPTKNFWLAFYLDVVGIAVIVMVAGIWWERAYLFFWLAPLFIAYTCIRKVMNWLGRLS
jgi:heme/copper-type cytochrome/quinol oxidase subunit 2